MSIRPSNCSLLTLLLLVFSVVAPGQNQISQASNPEIETVIIKVSVADQLNRHLIGLEQEHFRIYEDKTEQKITYFNRESAPASIGILLDVSASIKSNNNINEMKMAIQRFLKTGSLNDEYFLITFSDKPILIQPFSSSSASAQDAAASSRPAGRTAIYDAIFMGFDQMKHAKNSRKALLLITDGEDNDSRHSPNEIRQLAKESDIQIYGIGEPGTLTYKKEALLDLAVITGGTAFFPNNFNKLDYYMDLVRAELLNQYMIGYIPTNKARDGKWRKIAVKLNAPKDLPKPIVIAKEGYYAPK
jgi:Ca-activated chloride channel homolog